jgi:2'-5' RNA ligase
VVWVGVRDGAGSLEALAGAVENGLARIGFPKERRAFTAHFTLGRVRSPKNAEGLLAAIRDEAAAPLGTVPVEEFVLMQSRLDPGGSVYTTLEHFPLGRA